MSKLLTTLIFNGLLCAVAAQAPATDSLRVWIEAEFDDSLRTVTLAPRLHNRAAQPGYFYWQLRLTDATLRPGNVTEKITGLVFAPPGDTVQIHAKTLPFSPERDFNAFIYISEEEFVVADTVWNFDDAYAAFKNRPAKPKPPQTFLAKDDFEIDALVFNETRTPFGREFFRKFSELWQPPQGVGGYWITIRETLTPGRQTLLSISLNNRELFQRYLVPRTDYIAGLAEQTVSYLTGLLQNGQYDGSLTTDDLFGKL